MNKKLFLTGLLFAVFQLSVTAQTPPKHALPQPQQSATASVEREIREFFDSYAEDLRKHSGEAIANRYDSRGYYRMGDGNKQFVSFDDNKKRYLTSWAGPKTFDWKDLSIDILSPDAAVVTGLFDWQAGNGPKATYSYTGVLAKQSGNWRILVEDESASQLGYKTSPVSGNPGQAGPFKYTLTAQPAASIAALRHTVETRITVKSGRKFILMGDLSTARVQVVEPGATIVVPANAWHVQWWETETVEEVEGTGPMRTERARPATPRSESPHAQLGIRGEVVDQNGAVIAGANVTVYNELVRREILSNENGSYEIALPDGTYSLLVESNGFRTSHRKGLKLEGRGLFTFNVNMEIANRIASR